MLGRYEAMLERRFYKALRELERLQAQRTTQAVVIAVDGDGPVQNGEKDTRRSVRRRVDPLSASRSRNVH